MKKLVFTLVFLVLLPPGDFKNCYVIDNSQQQTSSPGNSGCGCGQFKIVEDLLKCKISGEVYKNFTLAFMSTVNEIMNNETLDTVMRSVENLEKSFEHTNISESEFLQEGNLTAYLHKVDSPTGNLTIYASDTLVSTTASDVKESKVQVFLPEELVTKNKNRTVVFCIINSPKLFESQNISDNIIIGVSVSKMNVSGLKSPVEISLHMTKLGNREPKCTFYNYTSSKFEDTGCLTDWSKGKEKVRCLCNHLTYFAVLMISPTNISEKDEVILTYISLIGCSLSLLFLVVAILLYFIKWRTAGDHSQQVHVSLAVALILLNGHFLAIDLAAKIPAACIYVAVLLHYSMLATLIWTAIEGLHLYLLLLRVFNIYFSRYLLKLSLVGWGVPAVVVILIFIIDRFVYLNVGTSSNKMCYITNELVKNITIFGFFCLIFVFNLGMLVVIVRTIFFKRPVLPGQRKRKAKDSCTLLGVTCLLGISWGLIFFSFGQITTVGLYLFCIFNSLHGFFIFIWLCISKSAPSERQTNIMTRSTST